ncbi:MAG TPA: hypothetical protein VI072_32325 [Polyangiaceae bacterium]
MKSSTFMHRLVLTCAVAAAGCTSLQSVSVNGVPSERRRPVAASAVNTAFLGLHFDNDFVNGLTDQLRAQCPKGKVAGVFTKHETTWYVLVQERHVRVSGYCVYETAEAQGTAP